MQSDNTLLSVLVPAYNAGRFIRTCIESLLSQTYARVEILVCDDGSTDDTWSKMHEFNDSRLHLFQNVSNLGKNQTTLFLLEQSSGDYVTVHDADDISVNYRFEKQMGFLLQNPKFVMCGTNFVSFLNNGKLIRKSNLAIEDSVIRELIKEQSQFHGPTIVVRRSVIAEVGGLYRYFTLGEDIDFTMRVTEKFKVCNLPGHYYYYRHQPFSLTNDIQGYSLERLAHRELLYYLAGERADNKGVDTLMRGDSDEIDRLVSRFKSKYRDDPEVSLRMGAFRLLSMYMYSNALKVSWIAMTRGRNLINFKCFVHTLILYLKGNLLLLFKYERLDFGLSEENTRSSV